MRNDFGLAINAGLPLTPVPSPQRRGEGCRSETRLVPIDNQSRNSHLSPRCWGEGTGVRGRPQIAIILCALLCLAAPNARAQMEQQETPSVLLPGLYLDSVREPLKIGAPAPDFRLPRANWENKKTRDWLQLSQWRDDKHNGSIVVFWAFWCDTWKDMTRDLNLIRPQIAQLRLQVLAVSVDASQQPVAREAFQNGRIWWPVAIDGAGGSTSTCSANWGVRRVPTIFVLDKSGVVREVFEGFPGKQTFVRQTAHALKLKAPAMGKSKARK